MRIPKVENYSTEQLFTTLSIPKVTKVNMEYIVMSDKDKLRLIKDIERICRRSIEYKQYIKFLKDEINMTECTFFENVNNKNANSGISIEIHHEPIDLFTIVNTIVNKYIDLDLDLNPLLISEEVMKLHYQNKVGLVPLSATVHQLVHDGKIFIPLQCVYGDYLAFVEEYGDYLSDDAKNILQANLRMSKEIDKPDTSILEKKFVYLNVDGFNLPQLIKE